MPVFWQPEGYIPAVMGEGNESRIIPAIEGLAFPLVWGMAGLRLGKIYLCQFVARELLGLRSDPVADAAHRAWLLDPENACFAWSDQMVSGKARGSKCYPRGVTSWLWLGGRKPGAEKSS